jgi:hypothetical protein
MGANYRACLAILVFICMIAFAEPGLASAQTDVEFTNVAAFVEFGKTVTFQAVIASEIDVQAVFLTINPLGSEPLLVPVVMDETGGIIYQMDTVQNPLRAFTPVTYTYTLQLANGNSVTSPEYNFDYTDSRFAWLTLDSEPFEVNWYDRDIAFGSLIMTTAVSGLDSATNLLPLKPNQTIRVYVYNSPADMRAALSVNQPWVAGQSSPDLGVIVLSIPDGPEERLELERQLPHELMHVLLYQLIGDQYINLPAWLVEGLASVAELYPNPEYTRVLTQAAAEDKLFEIEHLCSRFPNDASGAFLAYAESASFVRFLHTTYGSSALRWLVEQYQNGLGCKEGLETALGSSITQLEYRWKQEELRLDPESLIFRNLLPYLLIFGVVFGAAAVTIVVANRRPRSSGDVLYGEVVDED